MTYQISTAELLDIERAWVIECWRCANSDQAFEAEMHDAKKEFVRRGWTYEDAQQTCPPCSTGGKPRFAVGGTIVGPGTGTR